MASAARRGRKPRGWRGVGRSPPLRERNPRLQLFCVGDDWQAINGFAGSDLDYYENFSSYFPGSERLHISTNYRSRAAIIAAGNAVMTGRPNPAVSHTKEPGCAIRQEVLRGNIPESRFNTYLSMLSQIES